MHTLNLPTAPASIWCRAGGGASNDLRAFDDLCAERAGAAGFESFVLGEVLGHPVTTWRRPAAAPQAPRLLIASGFHGEEAAGPWGVLEFLQSVPRELLDRAYLVLLPLVNATGFAAGQRLNALGENPNRGYGVARGADRPSAEGEILLAHAAQLEEAARDGVLSCHEDRRLHHAYVYSFERGEPGSFSRSLVATAAQWFAVAPDGEIDGCPVRDGLIHNHYDGSFEAWLSETGAKVAACIETPGEADFGRRVQAQAAMMRAFVELRTATTRTPGPDDRVA